MKICKDCGIKKPLLDFYKSVRNKGGLFPYCKTCHAKRGKQWRKDNPERNTQLQKEWSKNNRPRLRLAYKRYRDKFKDIVAIRRQEWNDRERQKILSCLMPKQDNCCAICRKPFDGVKPHFDHNHSTGVIRGLLCRRCNIGLAFIENEKGFVENASQYLSNYPAKDEKLRKYWYGNKVPS